jgi:hypothetical protein
MQTQLTPTQFQALSAMPIWQVIDNHTMSAVGKPLNRKAASRKVDRLDNIYGGYRYSVKMVQQ